MVAIAVIGAVFLTPALAHAATVRGTVAAKQANRHVLVLALKHGTVLSARVTAQQLHGTRIGSRLALSGTRLADGSFRVTHLNRIGSVTRARMSVVVLKTKARSLLVAGGGSSFSIRLNRRTRLLASTKGSAHAGEKMNADVQLTQNGPVANKMDGTGDAPMIDFSGTVTAMDATSITVTTDGIATVIQLPNGIVLPPIVQVGSDVEIVATISGSTLTLATIKLDGDNAQGDQGGCSVDQNEVEAEGSVTTFDATTITIQPGDNASPVTFAIPDGFTLPAGLADGSVVEARGELVNGVLTLTRLELQDQGGDGSGDGGGDGGGSGGDG
jgi:hypothetical protein